MDDPLPLVEEKRLDRLFEDAFNEKQDQVNRGIQQLMRAQEELRRMEKTASLAFPRDFARAQKRIQDGKDALAVIMRELHECREQLWKRRRRAI